MMTHRQKVLLPLTVLAFGVLLWQLMVVFFPQAWSAMVARVGGSAVLSAAALPEAQSGEVTSELEAGRNDTAAKALVNNAVMAVPVANDSAIGPNDLPVLSQDRGAVMQSEYRAVADQAQANVTPITPSQQQYMHLANAYQLAKMQRMLAEEEAAIAQAKSKLKTLGKQLHGAMGEWQAATGVATSSQGAYRVVYLDGQEGSDWAATLLYRGQYWPVHVDTVLANGDKVTRIDHRGVSLMQGQQERLLAFEG